MKKGIIRAGLLIAAFVLIAAGIVTQDYMNVMRKAVMICFECIGLG